jgi:tRNA(adenine34) deaminase
MPEETRLMEAALELAGMALKRGEFPVGCVIADGDVIVARAHRTGSGTGLGNEVDHAEINALRSLNRIRPEGDRAHLTLYCTMEPCLMCFAASLLSGIGKIVYAYEDVMGGGCRLDRSRLAPLYRDAPMTLVPGVLREQSLALFQRFFSDARHGYWADSLLSRYTLSQPAG